MLLDRIVSFLLPRENKFFVYLESIATNMQKGVDTFATLREAKGAAAIAKVADSLREIEHEGDELAHLLYEELDKTFVTPLDREDLHALCSALDDVLDMAEATVARMVMYQMTEFTDPMRDLMRIYKECADEVAKCVLLLSNLSRIDEINVHFVHVNTLENEADKLYRAEIARLFANPPSNVVELIRTKETLDALERAIDTTENVMDLMRSVVVKNG